MAHTGSTRYRRLPSYSGQREKEAHAPAEAARREEDRPASHIETLAAVVLSIAAVATAWSAYQSTRWGGIMAIDFNEAGVLRSESNRLATQSGQRTLADVTITADWVSAQLSDNDVLAGALRMRMTPELDAAMQRWLGNWQPDQPLPPGTPFAEGGYVAPGSRESAALEKQAEDRFHQARKSNQRSDNYVLTGVLFALSLFFAGISTRVHGRSNIHRMVYGAAVFMCLGIILLIIQPKSFGV